MNDKPELVGYDCPACGSNMLETCDSYAPGTTHCPNCLRYFVPRGAKGPIERAVDAALLAAKGKGAQ